MGRPTLLTPETKEKILDAVRGGALQREAAAAGGIAEGTLEEWLGRGRGTDDRDDPDGLYAAFAGAYEKAFAENTIALRGIVERGARGELVERTVTRRTESRGESVITIEETKERTLADSRAAQWMLARREPAIYGDTTRHQHSGQLGVHTVVEIHGGGQPLSFKAEEDPEDPIGESDKG